MIKSIFVISLILNTCTAFALQALPSNIIPLKGVLDLRYIPNFEASCTQTITENKLLSIFETSEVSQHNITLYEDSLGEIKIKFRTDLPDGNMTMTADIKSDGSGLSESEPAFQFYNSKNPVSNEALEEAISLWSPLYKKIFREEIGTSVTQGQNIKTNWCSLMNQMPNQDVRNFQTKFEDFSVKGISNIGGRDKLIVSGALICNGLIKNQNVDMKMKSWYAIDVQSGLETTNYNEITFEAQGYSVTSRENVSCEIKGSPIKKFIAKNSSIQKEEIKKIDKSTSLRLTELKELLDKNLITKEIFEQKRIEIMKAF